MPGMGGAALRHGQEDFTNPKPYHGGAWDMQFYPGLLGEFYTCMMKIWLFETLCAMNGLFDKDATPPSSKETQDPVNMG